jgi:hypothetical protein
VGARAFFALSRREREAKTERGSTKKKEREKANSSI